MRISAWGLVSTKKIPPPPPPSFVFCYPAIILSYPYTPIPNPNPNTPSISSHSHGTNKTVPPDSSPPVTPYSRPRTLPSPLLRCCANQTAVESIPPPSPKNSGSPTPPPLRCHAGRSVLGNITALHPTFQFLKKKSAIFRNVR